LAAWVNNLWVMSVSLGWDNAGGWIYLIDHELEGRGWSAHIPRASGGPIGWRVVNPQYPNTASAILTVAASLAVPLRQEKSLPAHFYMTNGLNLNSEILGIETYF
jgi:hypothetical protein